MTELGRKNTFFVRCDSILGGDSLPKASVKKAFKFEAIIPIFEDTEENIAKFLVVFRVDRSFKYDCSSLQEGSFATMSMATRSKVTHSNVRFGLSDLEDDMSSGLIVVKKEKTAFPLPLKKYEIGLTVKTLGSRKRKTSEATNLNLGNLGAEEVSSHVSQFVADIRIRTEEVERALKEQEKEWKATIKDLLKRVELLSKEKAQKEEEHVAEMEDVIADGF
ncbi:hypothetical protein Lser_V15G42752 [Lactuca serriola]